MKRIVLLIALLLCAVPAFATAQANIYLGNAAAGSDNGTSCANQHAAISWFNNSANYGTGSTQYGPGSTVHICGTVTIAAAGKGLIFQGSGSNGSPITIVFETSAKFTSLNMDTAIENNGFDYIVVDGGSGNRGGSRDVAGNTTFENTDTGEHLTYQASSFAVYLPGCDNCEIKNATCINMFVATTPVGSGLANGNCYRIDGVAPSIHDNWCKDAFMCINSTWVSVQATTRIYNNYCDNYNWCVYVAQNSSTATIDDTRIYNNHIRSSLNWDGANLNNYHHDGVFVVQNDAGAITNTHIYNNLFDGEPGDAQTSYIYTNTSIDGLYIFNNIFAPTGSTGAYLLTGGHTGDQDYRLYNNTFICGDRAATSIGPIDGLLLKNNIVTGNCYTFWRTANSSGTVLSDYNAFDSAATGTGHAFKWENDSGNTYAQYKSNNPTFDTHSITATVAGMDLNASYVPNMGSPLINVGVNLTSECGVIPALCFDFYGNARSAGAAWDIGAADDGSTPTCTPAKLLYSSQPGDVNVNVALGTVSVGVYDSGSVLCTAATDTITIANKGGTCTGMTLGGTASGAASSGVFTTTNLTENAAGNCTLTATASGLTGADSNAITISAGSSPAGSNRLSLHR